MADAQTLPDRLGKRMAGGPPAQKEARRSGGGEQGVGSGPGPLAGGNGKGALQCQTLEEFGGEWIKLALTDEG
eukprot:8050138-Pyramimonas_sp.AAC.1